MILCVPLFAERKLPAATDFFFQLWRYELTGMTELQDAARYGGLRCAPAVMMAFPMWSASLRPKLLVDFLLPEYSGVMDSSVPYDAASDSGAWVGAAIRAAAENPAADETDLTQETLLSDARGEQPESPAERSLRDAEETLRLYSSGGESLALQKAQSEDGGSVVVSANEKRAARRFFDGRMRLSRLEIWSAEEKASGARLVSEAGYVYDGDATKPASAVIREKDLRRELSYDGDGRPVSCAVFSGGDEKPCSLTRWKYNAAGKISERYSEAYEYKVKNGRAVRNVDSERYVYEYKTDGGRPDCFYYENGVLRTQTVYSAEDSYVSTLYFDDGLVMESCYSADIKTRETLYRNGVILRSRTYETDEIDGN